MRQQRTVDTLSEALRFIEAIDYAHELNSARLSWHITKDKWKTERCKVIVNYKRGR